MKLQTSDFLLHQKDKLREIIQRLQPDFAYVSILGTDVFGSEYRVISSGNRVTPSPDTERGFVLRVMQDSGFSEYSFNVIDVDAVCEAMRSIAQADRKLYLSRHEALPYDSKPEDTKLDIFSVREAEILPGEENPEEILSSLQKVHDEVRERHPRVVQLALCLSVTQVNKIFLSPNKDLYQSYAYSNLVSFAMAADENNVRNDYDSVSGLGGAEIIKAAADLAEKAASQAEELLSCEKIEPGVYDMICSPEVTGLIAHEAFGHGSEMDMFVKNRAKGQEYLKHRVASDLVVMHDGAAAGEEVSSYAFDDEGTPAGDCRIIDKGIFSMGMCDELSALQLHVEATGNGKRESWQRKAYTRMTNTYFAPGDDSLEDMIRSISHGYLLEGGMSGMEDPKNWGIQCVATRGREIRDGKLTGRIVSPVYLTGYVPDLLQSISMISPELRLSGSGYCGKGWKEWVKVSTGGSYIKARGNLN